MKVRRGNVFTRVIWLMKLFEFVVFNNTIIIYSECQSLTLFASLRSVKVCIVFSRISAWSLTLRAEALRARLVFPTYLERSKSLQQVPGAYIKFQLKMMGAYSKEDAKSRKRLLRFIF